MTVLKVLQVNSIAAHNALAIVVGVVIVNVLMANEAKRLSERCREAEE